ncbi:hypothetical protein [Streptomyces chartreusis]|uniref:hypothetical protein n=1 Tax=Streptomyces TaxID=1883 RepID=UPI003F4DB943
MSGRVKGGRLAHSIPAADEAAPAAEALAAEESAAEAVDAPNPGPSTRRSRAPVPSRSAAAAR